MRIKALVTAIGLLVFSIAGPLAADRGVGSIDLSSNPRSIAADGKSLATITAEVRDKDGNLVPDGTEIRFTASIGVIEDVVTTSAGTARAKLISADIPGTCVITASWVEGQAIAQINVDFGEETAAIKGPQYIDVDADEYVAYSIDHKVLEALGNVKIRYRSLELEAYEAQVDLGKGRIVARWQDRDHPVKIKTADGTIEGNMFSCDIMAFRGLLLSAKTGAVQVVDISKGLPKISGEEAHYAPEQFDIVHLADSAILVKAKSATIFPNDKILFKRANVYLETKRTISLPNYVLSLTGMPEDGQQYVGYSTGGLTLNLPFYYALSPRSSGALLVRHGESTGWGSYGQKPGWFIDLREKYQTDRSQGTFTLNRVTNNDWGARFSHSQNLAKQMSGYMYLDYAAHQSIYGNMTLNKAFNGFSTSLNLFGNKYPSVGTSSIIGNLVVQTNSKPIGKSGLRYNVSTRFNRSYTYTSAPEGYTGTDFVPTTTVDNNQRLEGNVYSAPWHLANSLSLRTSAGFGYVWGAPQIQGLSTQGTAVLDWKLAKYSSFQLNYRFSDRPNLYYTRTSASVINPIPVFETRRQTLSALLRLGDGGKWRASVYAIKGLDYSSLNLLGDLSYRLNRDWRLGFRSYYNDFGTLSYNDLEVELGHMVGDRELIAVWSQSQKKIMFELGSGGF